MNEREKPANQWLMDMSIKQRLEMYRLFFTGYLSVENREDQELIARYKAQLKAMRYLWGFSPRLTDDFEKEIREDYANIQKFLDQSIAEYAAEQTNRPASVG